MCPAPRGRTAEFNPSVASSLRLSSAFILSGFCSLCGVIIIISSRSRALRYLLAGVVYALLQADDGSWPLTGQCWSGPRQFFFSAFVTMPLTLSAQRPAFGAARHATGTASSQRGRAQAAVSAGPRMQATGVLGTRRKPERLVVRSLPSDGAALVSTPGPEQEAAQHGHSHEHDEDDHGHSHSHGHSHGGANAKHGHSHDAHEDGEAQLIAGIHSHSHSRRHDGEGNVAQRGLTAVFSFLGVTELAALLQDSISVVVTAWVLLVRVSRLRLEGAHHLSVLVAPSCDGECKRHR